MMLIGYARVSTHDQSLDLQKDALEKAGCEKIFTEVGSGAKADRLQLKEAADFAREKDTLVVWKLDRLGRSLKHLIQTVNELHDRRIGFRSLRESLDTSSASGKLFFHVFGALAEFERDLIRERTQAGLVAARARERCGGRPRLLDGKKLQMARALIQDRATPISDICTTLGCSRATLYRRLDLQSTGLTGGPC
ncbi:MAG: recombinase family protein [Bradyrhizobium sp.]